MNYQVTSVLPQDKKKVKICLDNGESFVLYKGEAAKLSLFEKEILEESKYQKIIKEVLGKRAIKRAMHLLEQQERTEKQLRDKLQQNDYPQACIEQAIEYVKAYHYVDDYRYACVYIRYHQEKESRLKLTQKLMMRGISRELIERAMEEEFAADEKRQIAELLKKKNYDIETADEAAKRKMAQFLMRRGFKTRDILSVMRYYEEE